MIANTVRCAALALTLLTLVSLQKARADVDVEVAINQPLQGQKFLVKGGMADWIMGASHHVASYTDRNPNAPVLNLTINVQYTLTHFNTVSKRDSQDFAVTLNQTVSYEYDLTDGGLFGVGNYTTSGETTANVGLTLADVVGSIGWSVENTPDVSYIGP